MGFDPRLSARALLDCAHDVDRAIHRLALVNPDELADQHVPRQQSAPVRFVEEPPGADSVFGVMLDGFKPDYEKLHKLVAMGFAVDRARAALAATKGDVAQAVAWLL